MIYIVLVFDKSICVHGPYGTETEEKARSLAQALREYTAQSPDAVPHLLRFEGTEVLEMLSVKTAKWTEVKQA